MSTIRSTSAKQSVQQSILEGDAARLAELIGVYKDNAFMQQWNEALKAHGKAFDDDYEKACAIIANKHYFDSWDAYVKFKEAISHKENRIAVFEKAADAIATGDVATLTCLLQQQPELIHQRSARNHHATLLHYVGANGVEDFRQRTPPNAVAIAEILLEAGADVDAIGDMYGGSTTLGLVATSVHPVNAGLQKALVDILLQYGADINHGIAPDYTEGLLINACLHNGRCEIVPYLAERGALLDLEGAAGAGILAEVKKYYTNEGALKDPTLKAKQDLGFMWACCCSRTSVVQYMLGNGFDISTVADGMTALHWAVIGGHIQIINLLLAHGAPLEIRNCYGGTVLGQALWSAYHQPKENDADIVNRLIHAGAVVEEDWQHFVDEILSK